MPGLTFTDHQGFQKTVLLSATGAAIAGLVAYALSSVGLAFPLTVAGGAAVAAAACGTTPKARGFYGVLGAVAGSLSLLWPQHPLFGLAVSGGGLGLLFAQHRESETRKTPSLGGQM